MADDEEAAAAEKDEHNERSESEAVATAAVARVATAARAAFVTATVLVVATTPNDFARPGVVLEVDIAKLGVGRVKRHPAHVLTRLAAIVVGSPVVLSVVPHHRCHGAADEVLARLVGEVASCRANDHILEGA